MKPSPEPSLHLASFGLLSKLQLLLFRWGAASQGDFAIAM